MIGYGARKIIDQIGHGMVLGVRPDGTKPVLIPGPYSKAMIHTPLEVVDVREVLESHMVTRLTENRNDCRRGWREMNLPGDQFHLYCLTQ